MMLRGLSAVDRFAQKYEHGNKPKNQFRMSIPMLSP